MPKSTIYRFHQRQKTTPALAGLRRERQFMNDLKTDLAQKRRVHIYPGEQLVASGDMILSTLLGSCVAACLYDPVNKIVGMNHFMLANYRYRQASDILISEAGRYGVHAMEMLINAMLKQGAVKSRMKAKAFGGGNVLPPLNKHNGFGCVGEVNVRFIRDFLELEKIPLVAADLGGESGRVIHFFSRDYAVHVRKVKKTILANVASNEKTFWEKTLRKHRDTTPDIQLWS
jgi:chemotaxis protein CheD